MYHWKDTHTQYIHGEVWKTHPEYPTYEFSSLGRVRGPKRIRVLHINKKGYLTANIPRDKSCTIHRYIALLFVKNLNPIRFNQVNHINGDKLDNRACNLEWCDASHNIKHALDMGLNVPLRGEDASNAKITEDKAKAILRIYLTSSISRKELAKHAGVKETVIKDLFSRQWRCLDNYRNILS